MEPAAPVDNYTASATDFSFGLFRVIYTSRPKRPRSVPEPAPRITRRFFRALSFSGTRRVRRWQRVRVHVQRTFAAVAPDRRIKGQDQRTARGGVTVAQRTDELRTIQGGRRADRSNKTVSPFSTVNDDADDQNCIGARASRIIILSV